MSLRGLMCVINILFIMAAIVLDLFIFNAHIDVQSAPFDTIKHKKTVNRVALPDTIIPFVITSLFLLTRQFVGVLLILPTVVLQATKIVKRDIYMMSTTVQNKIRREEKLSIVKVVNYFVVWVYSLIKTIFIIMK